MSILLIVGAILSIPIGLVIFMGIVLHKCFKEDERRLFE